MDARDRFPMIGARRSAAGTVYHWIRTCGLIGAFAILPRALASASSANAARLQRVYPSVGKLNSIPILTANEREEFVASRAFITEASKHRGGHRRGVLLLDAAHHHAQVAGFNDDAYALRLDDLLDGLGDLCGHALLNLEAAREMSTRRGSLLSPSTRPFGMYAM